MNVAVYAQGKDEQGNNINIIDNRKDEIVSAAKRAYRKPENFLMFDDLFGPLNKNKDFVNLFSKSYFRVKNQGALVAARTFQD